MDPKDKDLLNRTFEYARENNKILNKMRSSMRRNSLLKVLFWILVIIGTIWLYYYLEPYLSSLKEALNELKSSFESIQSSL